MRLKPKEKVHEVWGGQKENKSTLEEKKEEYIYFYFVYFVFSLVPQGEDHCEVQMSVLHIQASAPSGYTLVKPPLTYCKKHEAGTDRTTHLLTQL